MLFLMGRFSAVEAIVLRFWPVCVAGAGLILTLAWLLGGFAESYALRTQRPCGAGIALASAVFVIGSALGLLVNVWFNRENTFFHTINYDFDGYFFKPFLALMMYGVGPAIYLGYRWGKALSRHGA